jgi:hypothetical protein
MIELTEEQHRLLTHHETDPVRVIDPRTKIEYVLLPAAVYERLRALLAEDTVCTTAEMLDRTMAEDDAHLAEWQQKYGGDPA